MPRNRDAKKMLNLWADPETIAQVDELQKGLGAYKSEVLRRAIAEMYERYRAGKYNKLPLEERVAELEQRLAKLEASTSKVPTLETPQRPTQATTIRGKVGGIKEVDKIIWKELCHKLKIASEEYSAVANKLNDLGYRTGNKNEWGKRAVQNRYDALKRMVRQGKWDGVL